MGLGIGLIVTPLAGYVTNIPYLGVYSTILYILVGVIFIVKGI